MRCPKCGQQNEENTKFCFKCGSKIEVGPNMPPQGGNVGPQGMNMPPQGGNMGPQGMNMPPQGGNMGPKRMNMPPQGGNMGPQGMNMPSQGGNMGPQGMNIPPQGGNMGPQGMNMPPQGGNMGPQGMNMPPQGAMGSRGMNVPPQGAMGPRGMNVPRNGGNDRVPPVGNRNTSSRGRKKKNNNSGLIITASVLGGVLVIVAIILLLFATGVINPGAGKKDSENTDTASEEKGEGSSVKSQKPKEKKEDEGLTPPDDAFDEMIEPIDEMVDEAKDECDSAEISELDDGLDKFQEAIASYIEIGNQYSDKSKVEDKVNAAYDMYKGYTEEAIGECKSGMEGCLGTQPGQGYGLYFDLMTDFYTGHIGVATYLKDNEYNADPDGVEAEFKSARTDYISRLIERFNEFTELTSSNTWSRTECWTLMESVDPQTMILVDNADDASSDPLLLRYAWAAAYNKQKTAETNVKSGEWTAKHAADSIRDGLEETMYCPFLVQEYISYASKAGINCQAQMAALKQCEQLLLSEQGLNVSKVKDGWKLVWYFNDFGECTANGVDTTVNIVNANSNGIRREVREQIMGILASSFAQ